MLSDPPAGGEFTVLAARSNKLKDFSRGEVLAPPFLKRWLKKKMKEIHKIIAIVIQKNEFLMVRKVGKDIWTGLGGRPESGETEEQTLVREIQEEIHCGAKVIKKLGDFKAPAVFDDAIVKLSAYLVELIGDIRLDDPELEEYRFIPKNYKKLGIKLPPSTEEHVIPFLIKNNYLDW